jgi:hypothetical protein
MEPRALPERSSHGSSSSRWRTAAAGIFSTLCLVATLGAADSHAAAPKAAAALPGYDHVIVVVFENKQYGEIIGSSNAPYINQLANAGASLTGMKALTHPSQPNYFNLFSGSTQGITGDGCYTPQSMSAANLGQELTAAGKTFARSSRRATSPSCRTCRSSSRTSAVTCTPARSAPATPG